MDKLTYYALTGMLKVEEDALETLKKRLSIIAERRPAIGAHIEFNTRGKKEWLVIYLPLKKVIDITDSYELNKFVTKYIKL